MPPSCPEKVSRNRSIITRHSQGETYKAIAESLGISYGRVLELAARERERIFSLVVDEGIVADPYTLMAEYSISETALKAIVDAELAKLRQYQHDQQLRDQQSNKEWDEYLIQQASDLYDAFAAGETISELSASTAISESDVLWLISNHLRALVAEQERA